MIEIVSKRSWDSKVYNTGKKLKGKPVLSTFIQNGLHDIEPDGSFVECDNTLQVHTGNGYSHKAARGRYGMLAMSDNNGLSKQEITLLHKSGNGIKVKYEQSKTYGPFLDNDKTIRYTTDNVATIQQIATYKGCNLILTINNPATSTNEYKFSINPIGNYTYEEQNGNIVCVNDLGDNIYIKALYAKDANDDNGSVSLRLAEKVGNKQYFYKVIDLDWLRNAVGPVEVDPSITIDDTTGTFEDSYIEYTNNNHGGRVILRLTDGLVGTTGMNFLVKAGLSGLSGATVTLAKYGFTPTLGSSSAFPVNIYPVLKDWGEGTTNTPAASGEVTGYHAKYNTVAWTGDLCTGSGTDHEVTAAGTFNAPTTLTAFEVTVSNASVQAKIDGTNYGDVFDCVNKTSGHGCRLHSSESITPSARPYLYMEYTEGGSRRKKMMGILLR